MDDFDLFRECIEAGEFSVDDFSTMLNNFELQQADSSTQEKRLLAAMFERALEDALMPFHREGAQNLRASARTWFEKDDFSDPKIDIGFTFRDIAEALDINVERVREFLARNITWASTICEKRPRTRYVY